MEVQVNTEYILLRVLLATCNDHASSIRYIELISSSPPRKENVTMTFVTIRQALLDHRHHHRQKNHQKQKHHQKQNQQEQQAPLNDLVTVILASQTYNYNNHNHNRGFISLVVGDASLQRHECARVQLKINNIHKDHQGQQSSYLSSLLQKGDIVLFHGLSIKQDYGGDYGGIHTNYNGNGNYNGNNKEEQEVENLDSKMPPRRQFQEQNINDDDGNEDDDDDDGVEKLLTVVCDFHHSFLNPHTSHASFEKLATVSMHAPISIQSHGTTNLFTSSNLNILMNPNCKNLVHERNASTRTPVFGTPSSSSLLLSPTSCSGPKTRKQNIHHLANWFQQHHLQSTNQSMFFQVMNYDMHGYERYQRRKVRELIAPCMKSDVFVRVTQIMNIPSSSFANTTTTTATSNRYNNVKKRNITHVLLMDANDERSSNEDDCIVLVLEGRQEEGTRYTKDGGTGTSRDTGRNTSLSSSSMLETKLTHLHRHHGTFLLSAVMTQWSTTTHATTTRATSKKIVLVPTPETSIEIMMPPTPLPPHPQLQTQMTLTQMMTTQQSQFTISSPTSPPIIIGNAQKRMRYVHSNEQQDQEAQGSFPFTFTMKDNGTSADDNNEEEEDNTTTTCTPNQYHPEAQRGMQCMASIVQIQFDVEGSSFHGDANVDMNASKIWLTDDMTKWPTVITSEQERDHHHPLFLDLCTVKKNSRYQQHESASLFSTDDVDTCMCDADADASQNQQDGSSFNKNKYSYRPATLKIRCLHMGEETNDQKEQEQNINHEMRYDDDDDSISRPFTQSKTAHTMTIQAPPNIMSALFFSHDADLLRSDAQALQRAYTLFQGLVRWNVPLCWSLKRRKGYYMMHEQEEGQSRSNQGDRSVRSVHSEDNRWYRHWYWMVDHVSLPSLDF